METQTCVLKPWVHPLIEFHGRYVVDLKRGHFRQLTGPYETIQFDSERGQELCAAAGVVICSACGLAMLCEVQLDENLEMAWSGALRSVVAK